MKKGDKIIWDSGWGYDIGYFIGESKTQYHHYKVNMVTGVVQGECTYPISEIKPYSEELIKELRERYKY